MFKTNLTIAWRNLVKDKQFTFLNIFGLSAGLASALLIFLWVNDERSYDKFFADDARLYQLMEQSGSEGNMQYSEESSGLLSEATKLRLPAAEYAAAVAPPGWFPQYTISANDKNIKASVQYAGKDYFNIFSFELVQGSSDKVLAEKNSIVLSDEFAIKLFGTTENLLGKPVRFEQDTTFYVSGVFQKMPANSSQQFDCVLSFEYFSTIKTWVTQWGNRGPLNYIKLKEGTDPIAFNKNLDNIITLNNGDTSRHVVARKFSDTYLHNNYGNNSNIAPRAYYVKLFSILAIFVLVIACINFMNLSTAKASRRLKEIGIKKVVGAGRSQLIMQFFTESLVITCLAGLMAVGLTTLILPAFNDITGKYIRLDINPTLATGFTGILLATSLLAGSYPAIYMSGFNPLAILKGRLNISVTELLSRKGLVVFQFTLSTILIVAVLVIAKQVQFIQNTDSGFEKNNILRIAAEGNISKATASFINELKNVPGVVNASSTHHRMIGHSYSNWGLSWAEKNPDENILFEGFEVSENFIETMGMKMKEGRSFSRSFKADSGKIIINETALKAMALKEPLGKTIQLFGKNVEVIGVVSDFHFESFHEAIKPVYMVPISTGGTIVTSIAAKNQRQTIASIEKLYSRYNPGFPFTYNFLDEAYQRQYDSETKVGVLSRYFAGLAIIISCLGLFGLAAFTAQKRRKEIGVRKVIGASVADITAMLSKDFFRLILVSMCVAFPVAWWLMSNWLQGFVYRTELHPGIFLFAGASVIIITLLTIGYQSVKAALVNPIKSLRTE